MLPRMRSTRPLIGNARFAPLDELRAIAIIAMMLAHFAPGLIWCG